MLLLEPSWLGRAAWRSGLRVRDPASRWVGGHHRDHVSSALLPSLPCVSGGMAVVAELRCAWPGGALVKLLPGPSFGLGVRLDVLGSVPATRLLAGSGGTATRPRHADSPFRRVVRAGSAGEGLGPPHTCSTGAPPSALVGHHGPPEYLLVLWRARGGKRVALPASLRGGRGAMGSRLHAARPGKPLRVVVC